MIVGRESPVPKPAPTAKPMRRPGQPQKGESPPMEPRRLERQASMTLEEMLKYLPKTCDIDFKRNGAGGAGATLHRHVTPEARRYRERSTVERVNGRLKDELGGRHVRVRHPGKVMCHLMFGILALTVEQSMRLTL